SEDASAMTPHELVDWAEQEAGSPYLRTPPIKSRRKGIEFPCMNLFGDFLHYDSVADEIVLHDNYKYKGLPVDGPIDFGGPSTWCDLVHECVVENGYLVHECVVENGGSSNTEDKDLGSMSAGSSNTYDKDLEKSN
ncbi:hypothetical protein Tco_1552206, partial [Tanacetum coccineum]